MDTPNDHKVEVRGKLISKTLSEMQAQMKAIKGEVIAAEALKWTTHGWTAKSSHQDSKDSGKPPKLKSKPAAQGVPDDQLTKASFPLDDLKGAFEAMMDPNNQESSWSQQETSKPTDPSPGKPAPEASKPVNMGVNPSL